MTDREFLEKVKSINSWKSGGKRAPHKPLLILYALGRLEAGEPLINYKDDFDNLKRLLEEFGPPSTPRPQYPFLRLSNDGIWEVDAVSEVNTKIDYSNKALFDLEAIGKFTDEAINLLRESKDLVKETVLYLLENNFPETLHRPLLQAVGLEIVGVGRIKRLRDPDFRNKILEAYERSCAVCGYQIRRDDQIIGLEAAHIKWHSAGGPDIEQNGISMCILHHELFDRGLFTLNEGLQVKVSRKANGNHAFNDWLLRFHDQPLRKPQSLSFYPERDFIQWQVNEVFKGGYRD